MFLFGFFFFLVDFFLFVCLFFVDRSLRVNVTCGGLENLSPKSYSGLWGLRTWPHSPASPASSSSAHPTHPLCFSHRLTSALALPSPWMPSPQIPVWLSPSPSCKVVLKCQLFRDLAWTTLFRTTTCPVNAPSPPLPRLFPTALVTFSASPPALGWCLPTPRFRL